jgi:hypothetical protein
VHNVRVFNSGRVVTYDLQEYEKTKEWSNFNKMELFRNEDVLGSGGVAPRIL